MITKTKSYLVPTLAMATSYAFSSGAENFVLVNAYPYPAIAVEVKVTGVGYPSGQNDAEVRIKDSEIGATDADFTDILDGAGNPLVLTADAGTSILKFRINGIKTKYLGIFFDPKNANAGTITVLNVTS